MWDLWVFSGDGCQGLDGGKGMGRSDCRLGLYCEGSGQGRWSIGREKSAGGAAGVEKRGLGLIGVGLMRGYKERGDVELGQ